MVYSMPDENEDQEYNRQLKRRYVEAMQRAQLEERKKELLKQFLESEAFERLMNVKTSNYELYSKLVDMLISFIQGNRVQGKISEKQLRELLEKITFKKDTTIEFKHK